MTKIKPNKCHSCGKLFVCNKNKKCGFWKDNICDCEKCWRKFSVNRSPDYQCCNLSTKEVVQFT